MAIDELVKADYENAKQQCIQEVVKLVEALINNRHYGKLSLHYQNGNIVHVVIEDSWKLNTASPLREQINNIDALSEKLRG